MKIDIERMLYEETKRATTWDEFKVDYFSNKLKHKMESIHYFKECIDSNNEELSPDEIYDLKEIVRLLEDDIVKISNRLRVLTRKVSIEK